MKTYDHIVVSILGEFHNLKQKNNSINDDLDLIASIYINKGVMELSRKLDGFFTILIYDKNINKVFVIQDQHTSLNHLYYYHDNESLFLSTDVKELFRRTKVVPKVNKDILPTYLHYAFVPGNQTLFDNIYKLPTETLLEYTYQTNSLALLPNYIMQEKATLNEIDTEKKLVELFDEVLLSRIEEIDTKQFAVMFSGGYDSNFLLSRLLKYKPESEIKLFSYGSTSTKSEIHNIRRIIDIYKNLGYKLTLHDYTVKAEDIHNLPKMMFSLGEPISEPGVIFQASLAEVLKENNIDVVIGGDANDQVYDRKLYYEMVHKLVEPKAIYDYPKYGRLRLGEIDRIFTYKFFTDIEISWLLNSNHRFTTMQLSLENYSTVFTNYFLTKRLIVKHYGVTPRLPFLGSKYTDFIDAQLEEKDLIFKNLHVKVSNDMIPKEISQELVKATESTSPYSYIFLEDKETRQKLFSLILNSEVSREYFNLSSIKMILDGFNFAIENGQTSGDYYKASVLSCRIFTIIGFLVWHSIFISTDKYLCKLECNVNLFELLGEPTPVTIN
ncbi:MULTISPECIES: asparagine synthase-related protein [Paenibacillus]|uniref:asparagine synthase-related protein n=1 Tax=Paenibacillus TaxID=44249 RepID=UPI0022B935D7|nr:asparagine synthase-related protein [Paenibacillus caseinilyticus]MCZ8522523.1 asparagine synthase-related protein [Paenibacillus caseinilyticus]